MTDLQKLTLTIPGRDDVVVGYRGDNLDMALLMMIAHIDTLRVKMKETEPCPS